jgi:predicted nucleic acid-binding protein
VESDPWKHAGEPMKVLDTPLLLDLLRGRLDVRTLESHARGEELATTELNIYELEVLARSGPKVGRDRRLAAVQRLRRKLTILPVDERASQLAAAGHAGHLRGGMPMEWLMLGAAKAAGASAWWTVHQESVGPLEGLEIVNISKRSPQTHKTRD